MSLKRMNPLNAASIWCIQIYLNLDIPVNGFFKSFLGIWFLFFLTFTFLLSQLKPETIVQNQIESIQIWNAHFIIFLVFGFSLLRNFPILNFQVNSKLLAKFQINWELKIMLKFIQRIHTFSFEILAFHS